MRGEDIDIKATIDSLAMGNAGQGNMNTVKRESIVEKQLATKRRKSGSVQPTSTMISSPGSRFQSSMAQSTQASTITESAVDLD